MKVKVTGVVGMTMAAMLLVSCVHTVAAVQVKTAVRAEIPASGEPYTWRNVQIVAGGFVDGLIFNPAAKDVLYARTDIGGAYRWDPAARKWIPLLDWLGPEDWNLTGVESIGIDPSDAHRVYLAVGTYTHDWAGKGAILRSTDQGRTWQRTDLPFKNGGNMDGRSAGERLSVDPNKNSILFYGSRDNGLWHSADYGATWNQVTSFPVQGPTNGVGIAFTLFQPGGGTAGRPTQVIYAGVQQSGGPGLYRSTDGGAAWQPVVGQPVGLLPHHAVLARDGFLYLTYGNAPGPNGMSAGAVWKYDTMTGAWTEISPIRAGQPGASGYAGLAVDAQHPQTVMVATMDRWNPGDTLFRSTNGGRAWEDLSPKSSRDSSLSPYVTFGAAKASLGWWLGALTIDPYRPGHVLYGTGATVWASNDVTGADTGAATHWFVGAQGLEETAVNALISPPTGPPLLSGLGDIGGFTHVSLDMSPAGGMTENPRTSNTSGLDYAGQLPSIVARVGGGDPGRRGGFSTDGGVTWTPLSTEPAGSQGQGTIAVSANGQTFLWSQDGAAPAITRDHGVTWTFCKGLPATVEVVSDRVNSSRFYAEDPDTGVLFVSGDGGASFTAVGQPQAAGKGRLYAVPGHEGHLWLTINGVLLRSTDEGGSFSPSTAASGVRSLGFGKNAPGQTAPALFILGTVAGQDAIFRSDDSGTTWVRINDPQHQYATADLIIGDPRVYGRAYVGTNGRGILYGDLRAK